MTGQVIPYYGLVDSGSDHSVIPKDLARYIGVEYDESKPEKGGAVGDLSFTYFTGTNQLSVQTEVGGLVFDQPMVADEDDFILSRHDFFRRYVVTFNEREAYMDIAPFEDEGRNN